MNSRTNSIAIPSAPMDPRRRLVPRSIEMHSGTAATSGRSAACHSLEEVDELQTGPWLRPIYLAHDKGCSINASQLWVYGNFIDKPEHHAFSGVSPAVGCIVVTPENYRAWLLSKEGYLHAPRSSHWDVNLSTKDSTKPAGPGSQDHNSSNVGEARAELERLWLEANVEDSDGELAFRTALRTYFLGYRSAAVAAAQERIEETQFAGDQLLIMLDVLATVEHAETLTQRTYALSKALGANDPALRHKATSCLAKIGTALAMEILRQHLKGEQNSYVRNRIELELA